MPSCEKCKHFKHEMKNVMCTTYYTCLLFDDRIWTLDEAKDCNWYMPKQWENKDVSS